MAAAFVALAGAPARAADDFHVELTYQVPGAARRCWDEAEFRRSVARRVGYDPFQAGAPIGVSIRITGPAHALEGRVDWRDADGASMGERRLAAKNGDCAKLLTEIGFAVALQIELLHPQAPATGPAPLTRELSSTPPAPPTTPPPPPPAAPIPPPPDEPIPRAEVARPQPPPAAKAPPSAAVLADAGLGWPWSWTVGGGPALAWRLGPSLTAEGRLFVSVRRRNVSFQLAAEATYPATARQNDGSAFSQSLLGGGAALCRHRFELAACAVVRVSQVRVSGLDVDLPRTPDGLVVQAGGRLAATAPLGGVWSLAGYLEVLGLITPYRVILNQAAVWQMPRLGGVAGASLAARFR